MSTYSVKHDATYYYFNAKMLKTLGRMHSSYHIIHVIIYAFVISYFMLMHIGLCEGITLLEFNKEEEEEQQETP